MPKVLCIVVAITHRRIALSVAHQVNCWIP